MANSQDPVVIRCKFQDFREIYRAVTSALATHGSTDSDLNRNLRNALLRLSEADGVEKGDLADPSLWNL